MTAPGRQLINEQLGLPLIALYNAVESFKIAFMCEKGEHYHLHEDLCHVRIVDRDGEVVPTGESGEVVISNLVNRATVLLNYHLGDVAFRTSRSCGCGRTLPLLGGLVGRVEDILILPEDTFLHPVAIWGVFKARPDVLRYQLIQHESQLFELRLVTTDEPTYNRLLPEILRDLQALLGQSATIEPTFYERLATHGRTGKFRAVISMCGRSNHAREQGAALSSPAAEAAP